MKKIKYLLLSITILAIFCSCESPPTEKREPGVERTVYEDTEDTHIRDIKLYKGDTYLLTGSEDGERIMIFDENGEQKLNKLFPDDMLFFTRFDIHNDTFYGAHEEFDDKGSFTFFSFNIETDESKIFTVLEGIHFLHKLIYYEDKLYWLAEMKNAEPFQESFMSPEDEYVYFSDSGYALGCIDLNTCENSMIDIAHPISLSKINDCIIVYAYEEEKGYYFYDLIGDTLVTYTNHLGMVSDLEIINDKLDYVYIPLSNSPYAGSLCFGSTDKKSGFIQLDDGLYLVSDTFSTDGEYLAFMAKESLYGTDYKYYKYRTDIDFSEPPIRVITASGTLKNNPLFGCGFQTKTDLISLDEFSLTVLSLDKDYNMAILGSNERFASDIKNNGSFYPLNDISGVKEYIDSCFPSVKEAAYNENGDIWMLPLSIDVPAVVYNETNCSAAGLTFPSDPGAFIEELQKVQDKTDFYFIEPYFILQSVLNSYAAENESFDTDKFRALAEPIIENYNKKTFNNTLPMITNSFKAHVDIDYIISLFGEENVPSSYRKYGEIYENALFAITGYLSTQNGYLGDENQIGRAHV